MVLLVITSPCFPYWAKWSHLFIITIFSYFSFLYIVLIHLVQSLILHIFCVLNADKYCLTKGKNLKISYFFLNSGYAISVILYTPGSSTESSTALQMLQHWSYLPGWYTQEVLRFILKFPVQFSAKISAQFKPKFLQTGRGWWLFIGNR